MARPEQIGPRLRRARDWVRVRVLRRPGRWLTVEQDNGFHVVPLYDRLEHAPEDCVCGPTTAAVPRDDGSYGWVITHHSLDGREQHE